jgi:hypothetical protein
MLFILEKYFPQKVEIYTYIKLLFSSLSANPVKLMLQYMASNVCKLYSRDEQIRRICNMGIR